jgi:DNA repair protein RadC
MPSALPERLANQEQPVCAGGRHRKTSMTDPVLEAQASEPQKRMNSQIAHEYKIVSLRECPLPDALQTCDKPALAAEYWRANVTSHPMFNPDVECFVVLLLNTRRRIKGHFLVSTGLLDQILVHPREVFRPAIVAAASAVLLLHNHPSGDSSPSEADVRATRDLTRAGQLLKIEVVDHVILGGGESFTSLRELGYFCN